MRCIGVKALKNKLSEYLRLIAAGESVLVTDRDRVIAEMIPPREGRSPQSSDAVLADAVRKGWITPAILSPGSSPPRLPVDRISNILRDLEEDRAGR
jgi:antitoxin (DNA-binding transcriptional repressor) of toxin-antitoxin stability system